MVHTGMVWRKRIIHGLPPGGRAKLWRRFERQCFSLGSCSRSAINVDFRVTFPERSALSLSVTPTQTLHYPVLAARLLEFGSWVICFTPREIERLFNEH